MGCIARSARSYHPARTLDEVDKQGRSDLPSVRFVRSVRDNIHRTCLRVFSEIWVRFIISLFFLCKVTNPHKHHRKENRRKRHLRRKLSNFLTLLGCSPSEFSKICAHLYILYDSFYPPRHTDIGRELQIERIAWYTPFVKTYPSQNIYQIV